MSFITQIQMFFKIKTSAALDQLDIDRAVDEQLAILKSPANSQGIG